MSNAQNRITDEEFQRRIGQTALELSRFRKLLPIVQHGPVNFLDFMITSTSREMRDDWGHECAIWAHAVMNGELCLSDLNPQCYRHFEGLWLDNLKEYMAYLNWLSVSSSSWSSDEERQRHYLEACAELRNLMVNPTSENASGDPRLPVEYLKQRYLASGAPAGPEIAKLIQHKANRLPPSQQYRANEFVDTYYGNILKAIAGNAKAADRVIEAIDAAPTTPGIVNVFEALLVMRYVAPLESKAVSARAGSAPER